jgi:hypothetical protein
MIKNIFLGALFVLVTTQHVAARPEVTKKTQCVEVVNQAKSQSYTCLATNTGGAGVNVLIYAFNHKKYEIVETTDADTGDEIKEMNDLPVFGYARDRVFKETEDKSKVAYYCYLTKKEHICAVQ